MLNKNKQVNQCDGCRRNLPIQNGAHFSENGHIDSYCSAERYSHQEPPEEAKKIDPMAKEMAEQWVMTAKMLRKIGTGGGGGSTLPPSKCEHGMLDGACVVKECPHTKFEFASLKCEEWEKGLYLPDTTGRVLYPSQIEHFKSYIKSLLAKQREKVLTEIVAKLHTIPCSFPERESDEYDSGYQEALREARHIIKDFLLKQ